MPVTAALAAPAAAAGLMYLDAKIGLSYDLRLISSIGPSVIRSRILQKKGRLNHFYVLEDHAHNKKLANSTFIIFQGRRWTFKQVYETTLKYGTWLKQSYNIKVGEIVCMDFQNSEKFVFLWLGLWSIGAKPAFINYNLSGKALAHCVRVSTSRLVLVDPIISSQVTDDVRAELPNVEFVIFSSQLEAEVMTIYAVREPDSIRETKLLQDMSLLIYTSGTTGLPKPAVVSWTKSHMAPHGLSKWMGLKRTDVFYTCMPLYHTSAGILGFAMCLVNGTTFALGQKFSTKNFWQDVRESDATIIQYVGETCRYLLSVPPQIGPLGEDLDKQNKVRMAFGNGLRPDVWNKFKERFGIDTIAEFYSATEASGVGLNYSRNDFSKGAVGRAGLLFASIFGKPVVVELDVETETPQRDENGFCKQVPPGEPGELLYPLIPEDIESKYQGYFNNKNATYSKVLRDVLKKGDAYYRTGDVARLDAEGRLYFVDRIGDTYRWKGENVSTNEVAEVFGSHASVEEANVYGIELPNHDGRAGCVALILIEDPSEKLLSSLAEHTRSSLPRFAVPLFLRHTRSIERTGTNKQQKHILRAQGVDPAKKGEDELYWLRGGTYVRFGEREWMELNGGKVKL